MSQIQYIRDRMIISSWQAKYETSARWGWDVIVELLPCTQALPPIQSPGKEFQPTNLSLVTDILETIPSDSACQTLTLLKSWSLGVQKKKLTHQPPKKQETWMVASCKHTKKQTMTMKNKTKRSVAYFWHPFLNQTFWSMAEQSLSNVFWGAQGHPSTPPLQERKAPVTGVHVP